LGRQFPTLPVFTPLKSSHEALVRERFRENRMTPSDRGSTIQPPYDEVIFDMDGVVTDTASLHAKAWKHLFDQVLADPRVVVVKPVHPFDVVQDYRRYVDDRRREDGVVAFLRARGVDVPMGTAGDPAGIWTVHGLAARKNDIFLELISAEWVQVFPGTAALVERLRAGGTPLGLVTASRNAEALLSAARLERAFDVVVEVEAAVGAALESSSVQTHLEPQGESCPDDADEFSPSAHQRPEGEL
jgi:beta-phosphoglucomutase-like phosphatase (HAD superfamily)